MIGYQFGNDACENIAGDENDPTGGMSFEVIHPKDKAHWQAIADARNLRLIPVDEDEIEEWTYLASPPIFWTVAIFLIDKAYGGAEEGGWYFTTGSRCDEYPPLIFNNETDARAARRIAQDLLDADQNVGRRCIDSVLSEGKYDARVYGGYPPSDFPARRPHYE